jgi:ABC-2 type transport system permease protein
MSGTTSIDRPTPTTVPLPRERNSVMHTARDTWLIFRRSLLLTLRQPVWVIMGLIQPVLYLALFGPLLDASVNAAHAGISTYNWFVPGLLVQTAMFGSAFTGFGLIAELRSGVVERMRVTPLSRVSMLLGRSLRDVVILVTQGVIMMVVAIPFGLRVDAAGAAATVGILALIGLVMAPLSYAGGLYLKSEDAFAPVVQGVALPLLFLSGILLPLALAPDWLRFLADLNPLSHAANAARALFNGDWTNSEVVIGVALTAVLAAVAVGIGSRAFSRAAA